MARILLVDDERSIRMTLRVFLENAGHEVALAEDAEQGLDALAKEDFDILVTDIILPRMSGVELVKAVRQMNSRIQIIMMTGEPTVETAAEAVRAGAMDYITKPITRQSILKAVNQALRLMAIEEERRRLEEENRRHQEQLEKRVQERTTELTRLNQELQRKIRDIKKTKVEASAQERLRVVGQLSMSLAEDFGMSMNRLQLDLAPLLKEDGLQDPEVARFHLRNIGAVVRHARQVVWKLREFCHPRETLRLQPLAPADLLPEVIEDVMADQRMHLPSDDAIKVEHHAGADCVVMADEVMLKNALHQVVLNAVQAMPEGGTLLWSVEKSGGDVVITIGDTGVGMSPEVRERCFDLFFTTREDGSPGIGLSLARNVVALHGGTMTVESESGQGTNVVIRMPAESVPEL